jgi:predicted Zn-dependent peptidase
MKTLNRIPYLALAASCLSVGLVVQAQNLEEKVTVRKLKNGLTVIFAERHEVPTFSAIYGFKVGAVDEVPGITGLAHLFEHMAFKGTPLIGTSDFEREKAVLEAANRLGRELSLELLQADGANQDKIAQLKAQLAQVDKQQKQFIVKDEIDRIYKEAGGVGLNASTGKDQTQYYISLPANRFELFCLVESERIKNAVLREFYTERNVVQEERKQTTEAVPARMLSESFLGAAFVAHPYQHPVVGWASDIRSVTLEEAIAFKRKYYTPNNCVMAIVGDLDPEKAMPLVEKYFDDCAPGEEPPLVRTVEPKQIGERRVRYEAEAEPQLMIGFHKPCFPNRDDVVLMVTASVLTSGRSSRMYRDLVKEKQLAVDVNASSAVPGERFNNLFVISGTPRFPHTNDELEKAILEHLEVLKEKPVTETELQKVKNNVEARYIRSMESNMGLAMTLMRYQLIRGDWKLLLKMKDMVNSVTPEDIRSCARKYFVRDNATFAQLIKRPKQAGATRAKVE